MSCDCSKYVDCGDGTVEVGTYDEAANYTHKINNMTLSDDILKFYQKTDREFIVKHSWDRSLGTDHVLSGCGSNANYAACDNTLDANPLAYCKESCVREVNTPYYWDRQREIYLWKYISEKLFFEVTSTLTARFREKWGYVQLHKVCIPTSVKVQGLEQFILVRNGVQTIIAESKYSYNPFPYSDQPYGVWGQYGNVVTQDAVPDTPNVACILIFPNATKQSTTDDNDVIHYGFYDYNSIEGGFTESSLALDDGGKDYFYPYWCRSMPIDPLWRKVADLRFAAIADATVNMAGVTSWNPDDPTVYPWPFGSFALDSKENFVASCILQFGPHSGNNGVIYNYTSMGDLFEAIKKTTVPLTGKFNSVYPVTPA